MDRRDIHVMILEAKRMIVVTEDHGGYEAGYCRLCGERGWLEHLKHKPDCLMNEKPKYLEITIYKE